MKPSAARAKSTASKSARRGTRLFIVTGVSGSGLSTAMRVLEDLGFYCVDNLPVALAPSVVMFLGLLAWMVTDYFRFQIPDFRKDRKSGFQIPDSRFNRCGAPAGESAGIGPLSPRADRYPYLQLDTGVPHVHVLSPNGAR